MIASPALWNTVATAEPTLPPRTADEIIANVLSADPVAFSGEVSQSMNLGLPTLPGQSGVDLTNPEAIWSLASGTNTWRLWYDGEHSYRVAILRGQAESDLISNGSVLWVWSSQSQTAVRTDLPSAPAEPGDHPVPATSPQQVAQELLREIEQYSTVATDANVRVAGRAAYELVVTPTDSQTRVAQARIAVDAETSLPLRLQVFSTTSADPAIEIAFTKINFAVPNASVFEFTPPPGAEVIEGPKHELGADAPQSPADEVAVPEQPGEVVPADQRPTSIGEGWSQVVVTPAFEQASNPLTEMLPRVSGKWGSGVALDGTLISVVFADDGRVAFGAVAPETLYQALAR